jgi:hypothetical protein
VVYNWVEKFSQGRSKVADYARPGRKWLRQQSKDFYAAGFDGMVERVSVLVEDMSKNNVFPDSNIKSYTFYNHL